MHSVYVNSLKTELLRMAFQMWGWIRGRWSQHFKSSSGELEIWQIASSEIFAFYPAPLRSALVPAMRKISCETERVKPRLFLKPFACGWRLKIPHCIAVSCPWEVKLRLEVAFQLMTGSGSISHKWDYLQCSSVQDKFPLCFTSPPWRRLHSWLWEMMV